MCKYDKITICDTFAFAVKIAAMKAEKGQTVLLSPASASFDEFSNYEERGDKFVEIVRSIPVTPSNEKEDGEYGVFHGDAGFREKEQRADKTQYKTNYVVPCKFVLKEDNAC